MFSEWLEMIKARKWIKKNVPFLYSWHAYVGAELNLFDIFKKPLSVEEAANRAAVSRNLLKTWVEVGVVLKHLKQNKSGTYQVKRLKLFPKKGSHSGALMKEMMELHIPSLLDYPELMKEDSKLVFNHEKHGGTVAQASRLIEPVAYPSLKKVIRESNATAVIDVGCGSGGYLHKLANDHPELVMTGIDNHPRVAEKAKVACESAANVEIIHADVHHWNPPMKNNDVVMLNNLLHYVKPEKRIDILSRISRWIHHKGKIVLISPVKNSEYGKEFSSAFNSFFHAHSNLHPLPDQRELEEIAEVTHMKITQFDPIIKEGSWYLVVMENC
ncbi:trans-aconitate 2-methyltransferase [Evansella sp. AB-rgal1]|uniref:class I SAM-dependent methyltransferase n=1 Tax=Evansella sp. AB-rgal1 TaxID=3242696 RepID=UPI00359ECE3D